MRSPLRPLPAAVTRWIATARVLGWLDALAAYLAIWVGAAVVFPSASGASLAVLAALVAALGALLRPLRVRWRPVRGAVALVLSARLTPGDQAWYVRPGHDERVLVTARRRTRVVALLGLEGWRGV